jgi:hypothetical protein
MMKHWLLKLPLFALCAASACATVMFDEDFEDSSIYVEGRPLPVDKGIIHHGQWDILSKSVQPGVVGQLEGNSFLELRATDRLKARAIGRFGYSNAEASLIADALQFRLSFKISTSLNDTLHIQLCGGDGKARASVGMDNDGRLNVSFGGEREIVDTTLRPHTWYVLEFLMPEKPKTKSAFTFNLYEADGKTLISSKRGQISRSVEDGGSSYSHFDIQHNVAGEILFIDNIKAVVNPETLKGATD